MVLNTFAGIMAHQRLQATGPTASPWRMELRYHTPLSPEEQLAHGLSEPQTLAIADRVRYSELDVLNHVNNKVYMEWFETLRTEHYYRLCMPYFKERGEPRTVVRSAEIHYVQEMLAGQSYITTARIAAFRNTSYTVEQMIWSDGLRTRMRAVVVLLNPQGPGRYPLPDGLKRYFADVEGATAG